MKREHAAPRPASPEEKNRILAYPSSSRTLSIAEAVLVKNQDLFCASRPDGKVPLRGEHGFGLYYRDCRYLNGYAFEIEGAELEPLVAAAHSGFEAHFELTNTELELPGGRLCPARHIGVQCERMIEAENLAMHDAFTFRNHSGDALELPVTLTFSSAFEDVFEIRGLQRAERGTLHEPAWRNGSLRFVYEGADGVVRWLLVGFSHEPHGMRGGSARFRVRLPPRGRARLGIVFRIGESADLAGIPARCAPSPDLERLGRRLRRISDEWLEDHTHLASDSLLFDALVERALRDLRVLRSEIDGRDYYAAGLPWFATLFGRDSLLTAIESLAFRPDIAEDTLRLLAEWQGREVDTWKDEEPGKILHELRVGELARLGRIPHTPYYGTVDATPLFLVLMGLHARWCGDLGLFEELRGPVESALAWMETSAEAGGGYIEYRGESDLGLVNQGWKDSGDAIVNADGTLAEPPIALVEVQAYAYEARLLMADLFERCGEPARAAALRRDAEALRRRFERDFWLEDEGVFALALQAGRRPARVVTSNAGHALWAGIAGEEQAKRTARRLLQADMFSGWGVRTLSRDARRYNPVGYHLGTVWPHDNSLLAHGFRRYGLDAEAARIGEGILRAGMHFPQFQLPEVFAGFSRDYGIPVRYPVACHPQAWAAGSVLYLTTALLGLQPHGFERRLEIVRPMLPDGLDRLEVRGLRVAGARADLAFRRVRDRAEVQVLGIDGDLRVDVRP